MCNSKASLKHTITITKWRNSCGRVLHVCSSEALPSAWRPQLHENCVTSVNIANQLAVTQLRFDNDKHLHKD